ncbi:MAG: DUF4163 domain-containing protein [Halanaerobiales bacterium]
MKSKIMIFVIMLVIFSVLSLAILADESKVNDLKVYQLNYCLDTEAIEIDVVIPVIKGLGNQSAQEEFNQKIRDDILGYIEVLKTDAEDLLKYAKEYDFEFLKYQIINSCSVENNEEILSLVISEYQYAGGAHGSTYVQAFNIDIKTGEDISLEEYLKKYDQYDYSIEDIKSIIISEVKESSEDYYPDAVDMIKVRENFNYYLEDNVLTIYFQGYEITVSGNTSFKIDPSEK